MSLSYKEAIKHIVKHFLNDLTIKDEFVFKDLSCRYLKGIYYLHYKTYLFGILVAKNKEVYIQRSPKGKVTNTGYYSSIKCKLLEVLEDNGIPKYYTVTDKVYIGISRVELLCSALSLAIERNNGFDIAQLKSKLKLVNPTEIEATVGNRFLEDLLYKNHP